VPSRLPPAPKSKEKRKPLEKKDEGKSRERFWLPGRGIMRGTAKVIAPAVQNAGSKAASAEINERRRRGDAMTDD